MTESSIFVFDLSKETNLICMDAYCLLLYITGLLPLIPGKLLETTPLGKLSYRPAKLQRDDHLVIVKIENPFTANQLKLLIQTIPDYISDAKLIIIAQIMQQITATIVQPNNAQQPLFDRIRNIKLTEQLSKETKIEILHLWFTNAISGLFCITRSLEFIEFDKPLSAKSISCELTNKLKQLDEAEWRLCWENEMDHVILMDTNYYIIPGKYKFIINYPMDVIYPYIGLREPNAKLQHIDESVVAICGKGFLQNYDEIEYNAYYVVVVQNKSGKKRLKLKYRAGVFYGIVKQLIQIVNGLEFHDWCKNTAGVKWEIWFGRDEQDKLSDYRYLKEQNIKLQQQLQQLKEASLNLHNDDQ